MIGFRLMQKEDATAVAEVEKQCFAVPWSRESFWEEAQNEQAYFLLVTDTEADEEKIIGYAGTWLVLDEVQITNVAIIPAYQGRGIAHRLMDELMQAARERGAERMTLEVRPSNAPALALYRDCGFVSAGRRPHYYLDNGEDAEIMWKIPL